MKRILTTWAADGQPFRAPVSLDHIQDAYKEGFLETVRHLIGETYSASVPYILWGCKENAGVYVSEGAIFFNGEILYSPEFDPGVSPGPGLTLLASVGISYAADDPTTFENTDTHDIHQIRICQFYYGTAGSENIGAPEDFVRIPGSPLGAQVSGNVSAAAPTIKFKEGSSTTVYDGLGSSPTITLDVTDALNGATVELYTVTASVTTITIATTGPTIEEVYITSESSLDIAAATQVYMKFRYQKAGAINLVFIEVYNPAT